MELLTQTGKKSKSRCGIYHVWRAIQAGILKKLDGSIPCARCGKPAKGYFHRDDSHPLDVDPLCRLCGKYKHQSRPWRFTEPYSLAIPDRFIHD